MSLPITIQNYESNMKEEKNIIVLAESCKKGQAQPKKWG